jgi:hypothetical protein
MGETVRMAQLPVGVRSACRFFAFYAANGTLALDVMGHHDPRAALAEGVGSPWEQAMAIFTNVLDVAADGTVRNESGAMRRAAQYLRSYLDPGYLVEPPFEDWELELA